MNNSVTMYGASDDLIEIEGDIVEEFSPTMRDDDRSYYLAVSDGSVFRVEYNDNGCWRFTTVKTGSAAVTKVDADEEEPEGKRADGTPRYSDVVTLTGDVRWVLGGKDYAKAVATRRKASA